MSEVMTKEYAVEPAYLENLGNLLRHGTAQSDSFAELCESVVPLLAESREIDGLDNVPAEGPLIVVHNHPFHFDSLTMGAVFAKRPDIRVLMKAAPYTAPLPADNALLLRKTGAKADPLDVVALQAHLREGGSLLTVPWGALDHQARDYATLERAAQNASRYVAFSDAVLLPVSVDVSWGEGRSLPVESARITIEEPIMPMDNGLHVPEIQAAVESMYQRYIT